MIIAFHDTHLGIRGTSVAMYDYAHFNETILKNTSIIIIPKPTGKDQNDPDGVKRFQSRFPVFWYSSLDQLESLLKIKNCDVLYCIKYGKNDGVLSKKIKTVIHCVFNMEEPHGTVYVGVSRALAHKFNSNIFVPHMISLTPSEKKENLRLSLGIPNDAIVFGRYGGKDTMDLIFCWRAIYLVVNNYPNIFFLFANTPEVVIHKNIKYISKVITEAEKNRFIHTCDAHIECGSMGHSFGLAIGEFSVNNKPIIAYDSKTITYTTGTSEWNDSHIKILGDKGIYFQDEKEFFHILTNFDPSDYVGKDLNCYREFSPEAVMAKFSSTFLQPS
jgi:hypothetical protein